MSKEENVIVVKNTAKLDKAMSSTKVEVKKRSKIINKLTYELSNLIDINIRISSFVSSEAKQYQNSTYLSMKDSGIQLSLKESATNSVGEIFKILSEISSLRDEFVNVDADFGQLSDVMIKNIWDDSVNLFLCVGVSISKINYVGSKSLSDSVVYLKTAGKSFNMSIVHDRLEIRAVDIKNKINEILLSCHPYLSQTVEKSI